MTKKIFISLLLLMICIQPSLAQFKSTKQTTPFLTGGNLCPDYRFTNLKGDSVRMSDLRGSYVYIDVWASWCGPCISEIPHVEALAKEFKGHKITFLSLSIDEKRDDCLKAVKKHNISTLVWFSGPKHQITKDFDIRSIPRFILIDPQGIIVHNRMTRPDYPPTAEILRRLIGM